MASFFMPSHVETTWFFTNTLLICIDISDFKQIIENIH